MVENWRSWPTYQQESHAYSYAEIAAVAVNGSVFAVVAFAIVANETSAAPAAWDVAAAAAPNEQIFHFDLVDWVGKTGYEVFLKNNLNILQIKNFKVTKLSSN